MKIVVCDECTVQVGATEYGLAPNGWVSVDIRGSHKAPTEYCSLQCAVSALAAKTRVREQELAERAF